MAYYGTQFPVNLFPSMTNIEIVCTYVFEKSIEDLTKEEAAELAAYLVYPRPISPSDNWEKNIKRRRDYALRLHSKLKEVFN